LTYSNPLHGHPDAERLRKDAGAYVRALREARDLTQRELGNRIGVGPGMISQVENGAHRLPPERIIAWAHAVQTDSVAFAQQLMSYYDPHTFKVLFGPKETGTSAAEQEQGQ